MFYIQFRQFFSLHPAPSASSMQGRAGRSCAATGSTALFRFARRVSVVFALLATSACASLPDVTHLTGREESTTSNPTIVNSKGALSDTKSAKILRQLEQRAGSTDILARHIAAEERISGKPLVAGNKITLLDDGPATMRAMREAISSARDHINLETYIFDADEVGYALADLLIEKRRKGVVVNLIYDSVGAISTPPEFFARMRDAGVAVLEYNPINPMSARGRWRINQRDHRKILVVDGRIAFTGGVNISEVYGKSAFSVSRRDRENNENDSQKAAWRDTHMSIQGPVVAEFQNMFLDTWQRQLKREPEKANYFPELKEQGTALIRAIGSTPERGHHAVYKTYVSALANADRTIHLTTAYFVPDKEVLAAMKAAAQRGVDVRILFPSFSDVNLLLHAGRSFYSELLDAGIRVYERKVAMLHAKTAVIDGVWSTIGSTNLDMRSFLHNDEVNAVILNAEFAARMEAQFERDLEDSIEITAEQWNKRGIKARINERWARLFRYWL